MPNLYDFELETIDGEKHSLSAYQGKVVLLVNVASKCGLTPQYDGLQRLHESHGGRGLKILGLPCNQFAGQEPGSEAEELPLREAALKEHYGTDDPDQLWRKLAQDHVIGFQTKHPVKDAESKTSTNK